MSETAASIRAGLFREIEADARAHSRAPEKQAKAPATPEPTASVNAAQAQAFYDQARGDERAAIDQTQRQAALGRSLDKLISSIPEAYDDGDLVAGFHEVLAASPAHAQAYAEQLRLHHPAVADQLGAELSVQAEIHAQNHAVAQAMEAERVATEREAERLFAASDRYGADWQMVEEEMNRTGADPEDAARVTAAADRALSVTQWKESLVNNSIVRSVTPHYDAVGQRITEVRLDPAHGVKKSIELADAQERGDAMRMNSSVDEMKASILAPSEADLELHPVQTAGRFTTPKGEPSVDQISY